MPEPVTTAALAIGGVTWVALSAVGGVAGNAADRVCAQILRNVADRVAGLRNSGEQQDLARAVRTAQAQALEVVVRNYRNICRDGASSAGADATPELFFDRSLAFCAQTVGRWRDPRVKLNALATEPLSAAIEGILGAPIHDGPAGRRAQAIAFFAEEAVLDELRDVLAPVPLPEGFSAYFRTGDDEGHPSFLDLFGRFIGEQIKKNERFWTILITGQLARIEELAFDATEMLTGIEARFGGMTGELRELRSVVDRLTRSMSLSRAEKASMASDLARVKAEQNGTVELVAGFLETMIGRQVAPEQFPSMLFRIAADWKIAGERIDALSASRNLSPQLAELKADARAAHRLGHLEIATAKLLEVRKIEAQALNRLKAHERDTRQEIRLWQVSLAETRVAEAAIARAGLAYREAAGHYRAAANAIAPFDASREWQYLIDAARALRELGREFGDNAALVQAIDIYLTEALPRAPRAQRAGDWVVTQHELGIALGILGEREVGTARLKQAAAAYRAALEECTRDRVPLGWAAILTNLATVLRVLGGREGGTKQLEEAAAAHRAALEECSRDRVPLEWARIQTGLGTVLHVLGERESGSARLKGAVAAYRAALEEQPRDRVPLEWATTQTNLGNALARLGERESDAARLGEAVAAYRAALEEQPRDRVPLDWAVTQGNLGNALAELGRHETGTERLEEAVAAYRAALEELLRDCTPLIWAHTQNSLGNALQRMGAREAGTARLEEAVMLYRAALEEQPRERVPLDWAMTQNNLGSALRMLGERGTGTRQLEEAVAAFELAAEEYTRARMPLDWAMTQDNLGSALRVLGEREVGTARLEKAVAVHRAALVERKRDRNHFAWAGTQNNLGNALGALGAREAGTARLEEAIAAFHAALEEWTRDRAPLQWAGTQNNLGRALRVLGERNHETGTLEQSIAAFRAALEVARTEENHTVLSEAQEGIAAATRALSEADPNAKPL